MARALACLLLLASLPALSAGLPVPADAAAEDARLATARAWFDEAARQCEADHGRLWGESLCGPLLLVDPGTRQVIASQGDADGQLAPAGGVFVGTLPPDQTLANTALDWAGVRWSELLWPLPDDAGERRTLVAHEGFHRIQPRLGLSAAGERDNGHLDTVEGRSALQLEWRALDAALAATEDAERRARIADALAFRADRYRRFPAAAEAEAALERNEGLAEYTGVVIGQDTPDARLATARRNLSVQAGAPSFVRAFAYATGPAYGLLLDRYLPGWRDRIRQGGTPASLLAGALPRDPAAMPDAAALAARYDGAALLAAERARAAARERLLAAYRARLVAGPVLHLPLKHMKVQFNPGTLVPLGEAGTVYPTLHVSDDWGSVDVDGGALMAGDWSRVTVPAPQGDITGSALRGEGWTLQLAPGWRLVPDARKGDYTLAMPPLRAGVPAFAADEPSLPYTLPAVMEHHRFFVQAQAPDGEVLRLFTDSGGGLNLSTSGADKLGIAYTVPADPQAGPAATTPWPAFAGPWIPRPESMGADGRLPVLVAPPWMQDDGMLGAPWFGGRNWEFDYRAGTLRLLPDGALPEADAAHVVKLGFQREDGIATTHFPRIAARIDGEELQFLFDTGATFRLDPAAAAKLGDTAATQRAGSFITMAVLQRWRARHPDWAYLPKGDGPMAMIRVPEIEIAGYRTGPVWFSARPDANFHEYMAQWMDRPVDGALGGNAFAGFRITVDYPSATAVFER